MNSAGKLLLGLFCSITAQAALANDYLCKIDRVVMGSPDRAEVEKTFNRSFKGKEFSVNRSTGVMSGALKNNFITDPDVIDRGSSDNSFKVVTTLRQGQGMGPGSSVHVLIVNEYKNGLSKPFTYMNNDEIYFGTCRHF